MMARSDPNLMSQRSASPPTIDRLLLTKRLRPSIDLCWKWAFTMQCSVYAVAEQLASVSESNRSVVSHAEACKGWHVQCTVHYTAQGLKGLGLGLHTGGWMTLAAAKVCCKSCSARDTNSTSGSQGHGSYDRAQDDQHSSYLRVISWLCKPRYESAYLWPVPSVYGNTRTTCQQSSLMEGSSNVWVRKQVAHPSRSSPFESDRKMKAGPSLAGTCMATDLLG